MLELRGGGPALLDEPVALEARGAGGAPLTWRARLRDDDGLVWRTQADTAAGLGDRWSGKADVATLASLRPVALEVRAEAPDGHAAARTLTRLLLADGVLVRRWRDVGATLLRPPGAPRATIHARGPLVAAALLASRGVLVLLDGDATARERLALVPGAGEPVDCRLPLPPGVPAREPGGRATWEALLARLSAAGAGGAPAPPPA